MIQRGGCTHWWYYRLKVRLYTGGTDTVLVMHFKFIVVEHFQTHRRTNTFLYVKDYQHRYHYHRETQTQIQNKLAFGSKIAHFTQKPRSIGCDIFPSLKVETSQYKNYSITNRHLA